MINVMIVDDSGFMRLALKKMLEKHPDIRIVAEASSADEAVKLANIHHPDIITMDIEMPGGSGLEATQKIMKQCPTSIIMVSSVTTYGADETIQALNYGAVDFIPKASSFVSLDIANIEKDLLRKIHFWSSEGKKQLKKTVRFGVRKKEKQVSVPPPAVSTSSVMKPELIVIGASTGGPKVLPEIFSMVSKVTVPVVIALHMPEIYTQSFAKNMAASTGHKVVEGTDNMKIEAGMVVILPGGRDSKVKYVPGVGFKLKVLKALPEYTIHPSVNCLFLSAVSESKKVTGMILTGMGEDGLDGAVEFRRHGLPMIAQDKESSLVYGMPRAVVESGLATSTHNLSGLASKLNEWARSQTNEKYGGA